MLAKSQEAIPTVLTPPPGSCNRELLISYGMSGKSSPTSDPVEICPQVNSSCCTNEDQMMIYSNWVQGKEQEMLLERFHWHKEVFEDLLETLLAVKEKSNMIARKLQTKKVSNCKILTRRINEMQIEKIIPRLKEHMEKQYEFFHQAFKGFYCSLCDAEKTKFFNLQKRSLVLNEEFCRKIVVNTLHVLLYYHVYFSKYLNIVTKFISSCSHTGEFIDVHISARFLFSTARNHTRQLSQCHRKRNSVDWFTQCEPVCQKYKPTKFNSFFSPKLKKYIKYTKFLKSKIRKMDEDIAKAKLINGGGQVGAEKRVLETKKQSRKLLLDHDDTKTFENLKRFEDKEVFRSSISSTFEINDFHKVFDFEGLNFYKTGKETIISESIYKSLKAVKRKLRNRKLEQHKEGLHTSSGFWSYLNPFSYFF